jgi:hypothetical protein
MQFKTIALATAFALTSSLAFAQMGGGNGAGAEVPESSGTAVEGNGVVAGTVDHGRLINRSPGTTIGSAPMGTEEEINRGTKGNRMLPQRTAPDADEAALAGR